MKYGLFFCFLLIALTANANHVSDTIPHWLISYGKVIVIQGNVNAPAASYELVLKQEMVKDLTISFIDVKGQPKTSSLVVKEGKEILRTIEQDPLIGPYFVVPVRELISTHQPNVRYALDFYYSDDRGQKNLKLGTVIFILK